jgi:histidine ammonia-lyase
MTQSVAVTNRPMRLGELLAVADGAHIELSPDAVAVIKDSRSVVEDVLASGRGAYGLNLGLGHMKNTRLPDEQLAALQVAMIDGHAGAIGPSFPARIVRAAMAARVNGLARGGAGASLACAETYVAMLNAGVHPIVPGFGSVGASDLAQMAAIARVAIGLGEAELGGETLSGTEALRRAGIAILQPRPKDGLALMSANGISVGHGADVVARARHVLEVADIAAAFSLEAMSGNISPFDPEVAAAKGVRGQTLVGAHVLELLRGSDLHKENPRRSIQDPLSFRVVPQVHGALWDFIDLAWTAVETELNAMTDNPLVSRKQRRLISNGNFHPMLVGLAFDALRPALAHAGQLSDRRMNHLWAGTFEAPDDRPADANRSVWGASGDRRGTSLRYAAAAAAAALRHLAGPATLDVAPLDLGIEDHATGAPLSIQRTADALDKLEDVLAVELLLARDILKSQRTPPDLGQGASATLRLIDLELQDLGPETESRAFHDAVLGLMRTTLPAEAGGSSARLAWGD